MVGVKKLALRKDALCMQEKGNILESVRIQRTSFITDKKNPLVRTDKRAGGRMIYA